MKEKTHYTIAIVVVSAFLIGSIFIQASYRWSSQATLFDKADRLSQDTVNDDTRLSSYQALANDNLSVRHDLNDIFIQTTKLSPDECMKTLDELTRFNEFIITVNEVPLILPQHPSTIDLDKICANKENILSKGYRFIDHKLYKSQ